MNTGYQCGPCKFFGKTITLIKRHITTKKHLDLTADGDIENYNTIKYMCKICSTICCSKSNINRHIKHCEKSCGTTDFTDVIVDSILKIKDNNKRKQAIKTFIEKENKLKDVENSLIVKNKELELTTKINNIYENENKFHKSVVENAGKIVNKTVNMLTYAVENFKETPKLEMLDSNTARKLLEYEANDGKKGNVLVAEYIAKMSGAKILPKHLGNILIAHYKKDVLNHQSIWTTDANRIKFIVRTADGWIKDGNNQIISKIMVTPLLKEVSKIMDEYCAEKLKHLDTMTKKEESRFAEVSEQRITIKEEILNERLGKGVIKIIAPCFVLHKQITHDK